MLTREFIENEVRAPDLIVADDWKSDEVVKKSEEAIFEDDYLAQSILGIIDEAIFRVGFPGIDD